MRQLIHYFLLFIAPLIFTKSMAQCNLVPNPGFEINTSGCANACCGIENGFAPPWDSPSSGSPDLFNSCVLGMPSVGVPYNTFGFQPAHLGNGYCGIATYNRFSPNLREYIQVELDSVLLVNQSYCVSFYVNLNDSLGLANNNLGIYFSNTHVSGGGNQNLNLTPQINYSSVIFDTLNWTEVSGTYIAQGGERYIIIGNFFSDNLTDTAAIHTPRPWNTHFGYYYVDDVDVHECNCHVGVDEENESNELTIYPNPSEGEFEIKSNKSKIKSVEVFNLLGEEIYFKELKDITTTTVNINAPPGVYFIEVQTEKGMLRKKLVVQ